MSLRGNLEDFSLSDIFQLVSYSKKDGVLRIRRGQDSGGVWFHDGRVVFAQSNSLDELLGERLVRARKITRRTLNRVLAEHESQGEGRRRIGQALIEGGYLSEDVLETFVAEQVRETVFDLMRWGEGEFDFEVMSQVPEEDIGPALSIENIIMEGSRRLEEWAMIERKIPSTAVVLMLSPAPAEGDVDISLKPAEWALIPLIDGRRSVRDIALDAGRLEFDVARILYGLLSAGLLEFAELGDEEIWEVEEVAEEPVLEAEPEPEPEPEQEPEPQAEPELEIIITEEDDLPEGVAPELAAALAAQPSTAVPELLSETVLIEAFNSQPLLNESAPAEDAYVYESEPTPGFALASGLREELSALTGAERQSRPTVTHNSRTTGQEGELLRSHTKVSRETLLRIAATLRKR